jgi:hypothetical protein
MTNGERTMVMVVMRALVALCAGFVILVAVATFARPEPRPCHDKKGPGLQTLVLIICAPPADTRLVLTSAAAGTVLSWIGSGILQKRLVRP